MSKNKKILVLGSSGFLGKKVVDLLENKDYTIDFCDIKVEKNLKNFFNMEINEFLEYKNFNLKEYSYIIDVATVLPYKNDKKEVMMKNVESVKSLLKCKFDSDHQIIYVSSSGIYGNPDILPITINSEFKTLDFYGESKLEAESLIRNSNLNYSIIRPKAILGNGRSGIFKVFFNLINKKLPIPMPNNGNQVMQFVDVNDVARMVEYLIDKNIRGIFPAAAPNFMTMNEYLKNIENTFQIKTKKINISPKLFQFIGNLLVNLKLTNFTKWHFGGFAYSSYFDPKWKPDGFEYKYTSLDTFLNTAETYLKNE